MIPALNSRLEEPEEHSGIKPLGNNLTTVVAVVVVVVVVAADGFLFEICSQL